MQLKKSLLVVTLVSVFALALAGFTTAPASAKVLQSCDNSIVDIALAVNAETGEFSTLIAALTAANLVKTFDQCGPKSFTVFAPTDAAFEKLGLTPENIGSAFNRGTLKGILLYHAARGSLYAADVVALEQIRMLRNGYVGVDVTGEGVFLTSSNPEPAQITAVDIQADNGVIHIIDSVLLP